jgi:hypothetical protein
MPGPAKAGAAARSNRETRLAGGTPKPSSSFFLEE